jgi:hypothetical protein
MMGSSAAGVSQLESLLAIVANPAQAQAQVDKIKAATDALTRALRLRTRGTPR